MMLIGARGLQSWWRAFPGYRNRNRLNLLAATALLMSAVLFIWHGPLSSPRSDPGIGIGTIALNSHSPDLEKMPLSFEPNEGQTHPSVRFQAHAPGGTLFF